MEDGKQNNLFAHIQTVLIGAVGLGVLAGTYAVVDLIDPDASPYAHTAITGALALALLGAGWLAVKAGRETYARWALARLPVASSARLSIVVATLKGDKGGERSHRVTLSLRDQLGERVQVLPIGITVLHAYPYDDRQRQTAMKVVRRILEQTQADLLIWGTTHTAEKVIDLNFAARQTAHASSQSYALDTTLRLPENFGGDLGAALAAIAATSAAPAVDNAGKFLVPILEPVVSRLSHFIGNPPATLTGDSRADVFHAYALACARLGEQKGDSSFLLAAVTAYREALKECTRERVPLPWATTQNNLGNALRSLGERESGTARLEEAVTAYREALKERTRERVPLDWAMTQNNLGTALTCLGGRESDTGRLEEAVIVYREALKEQTRERVPLPWATTQNNLGNALRSLGERESGTARLEEAVTAYREALKERTRERVPLDWAMTQNNLGNALRSLGERESGTARLEEAVTAYREALKERTRERVPLDWAMTQNNLGTALTCLGGRESGTARLEEAAAAYREALGEFEKAKAEYHVGMARGNLERAERLLAQRRGKSG